MLTTLPAPIAAYFRAKNVHDTAAMLACFAEDAIVHDEEQEYRGITAIEDWIVTTTAKYQVIVDITHSDNQGSATIVTGRVSGNFPGSPVELQFRFIVQSDKIISLTINPT